ncbi:DUF4251 domain-containing protein [Flagellimonas sp.]|uniref:DUF4251 domain-containing protein n=1 Tax=Flagellimonas sp. TaxID=2058762 RepID=UPI003BAB32D6
MKTVIKYMFVVLILGAVGCASNPGSKVSAAELEALNNAISQKSIDITARWARPMPDQALTSIANAGLISPGSSINRIDITGSGSYLRVIQDSVMADLSYFGQRQIGGTYNPRKGGIHFKGLAKDFTVEPTKKGDGYTIQFSVNEGVENYQVTAHVFPSQISNISVVSSHRGPIWYDGTWEPYNPE